jgi:GNAT superfamily N-acetyltransferase
VAQSAPEFVIRRAVAEDIPFVFSSWLDSWRTSRWAGVVRNNDYYATTRAVIEDLLARGALLLVAEAHGTLLGFICGEEKDGTTVQHYLYVKDPFHGFGVEERLADALPGRKPGFFTFYQYRLSKSKAWKWAPEIARRKTL